MIFENNQLFFIILLLLWLFFVSEYTNAVKTKNARMYSIIQFALMIPLTVILAEISFEYVFGFIVVFIIPILSIYLIIDSYMYKK